MGYFIVIVTDQLKEEGSFGVNFAVESHCNGYILMRVKFWKVFKENVLCEC